MATKKQQRKPIQVPFDKDGNFVSYPLFDDERYNYKDNYIFEDTLQFEAFYRGRSSVGLTFRSLSTNKYFTMFLIDFAELLIKKKIIFGKVESKWTFIKRGANYGIKLTN